MRQTVFVLDFGAGSSQLLARKIRELGVYCEILPPDTPSQRLKNAQGIILTGSPAETQTALSPELLSLGVPLLVNGSAASIFGGKEVTLREREIEIAEEDELFADISSPLSAQMYEGAIELPEGCRVLAAAEGNPAAFVCSEKKYCVPFDLVKAPFGTKIIENFLFKIAGCKATWSPKSFVAEYIQKIRQEVGEEQVICALSGGVDSSVAATLVHQAIGQQLTCIFVDTGLMRKNEAEEVIETFQKRGIKLIAINAQDRFLEKLAGVSNPEEKRKIIGNEFIRIFEEEARKLGRVRYLVQGTLYADVVESGTGSTAAVKSHHNVGGLPEDMELLLLEPLRELFKDEVRKVGLELGLPKELVYRQPFPGPGLAVRIIGPVTREKLAILREADAIVREELAKCDAADEIWQCFAVLTNTRAVGVRDGRTYDYVVAVRAVSSSDGMTADWVRVPHETLAVISNRLLAEVEHVGRVVYDISPKPPGTIEWE